MDARCRRSRGTRSEPLPARRRVSRSCLLWWWRWPVLGLLSSMPSPTIRGEPIIPGPIFPFVFITIACGAISGFHSLVASGTTPKMIDLESHAMVGYGAMLMESFVGVVALIAASILVPGDYFAINTKLSSEALAALGYPI